MLTVDRCPAVTTDPPEGAVGPVESSVPLGLTTVGAVDNSGDKMGLAAPPCS